MHRIINDIQTIIKNAMSENLPEVSPDALEENGDHLAKQVQTHLDIDESH